MERSMLGVQVSIASRDFWVKVVDFLQQNWALVDDGLNGNSTIYFVDDAGGVFDRLELRGPTEAQAALARNGFARFRDAPDLQAFLVPPLSPFRTSAHPNGNIYSSGRFWC